MQDTDLALTPLILQLTSIRPGPNNEASATSFALANGPLPIVTAAIVKPFNRFFSNGNKAVKVTTVSLTRTFLSGSIMGIFCWLMRTKDKLL
jgi:hypothetical protein